MKKEFEHNLDELFGNALDHFEAVPSINAKEKILSDIYTHSVPNNRNIFRDYRKYFYLGLTAASLFVVYMIYNNYKNIFPSINVKANKNKSIVSNNQIIANPVNSSIPKKMSAGNLMKDSLPAKENKLAPSTSSSGKTNDLTEAKTVSENPQKNKISIRPEEVVKKQIVNNNISEQKSEPVLNLVKTPVKDSVLTITYTLKNNETVDEILQNKMSSFDIIESPNTNSFTIPTIKSDRKNIVAESKQESVKANDQIAPQANNDSAKKINLISATTDSLFKSNPLTQFNPLIEKKNSWIVGVNYSPELLFGWNDKTLPTSGRSKYGHDFSVSVKYFNDGFQISSGIGIAFYQKDIFSVIYYKTNNTAAFSNSMISLDTIVDPVTHKTLIDNSLVNINDVSFSNENLGSFSYQSYLVRYTYLQIPLMIGYQKELGKFFSTVNVGGAVSFLISKQEPIASEDIQIINLDHKTSMQINTNWLLEFNIGLGYHISRKIDFEMEPAYKYYIGSLNKNNDVEVKHPYSLGIISGFYFKF